MADNTPQWPGGSAFLDSFAHRGDFNSPAEVIRAGHEQVARERLPGWGPFPCGAGTGNRLGRRRDRCAGPVLQRHAEGWWDR